jgi:hypothetical protein
LKIWQNDGDDGDDEDKDDDDDTRDNVAGWASGIHGRTSIPLSWCL